MNKHDLEYEARIYKANLIASVLFAAVCILNVFLAASAGLIFLAGANLGLAIGSPGLASVVEYAMKFLSVKKKLPHDDDIQK